MIRDSRRLQPLKPESLVTALLLLAVSTVPVHAAAGQPNGSTCTEMHQQALDLLKSSSNKALKVDQAANKAGKSSKTKAVKPESPSTGASTADNKSPASVTTSEKPATTPSATDFQTSFRNLILGLKQKNCAGELESLNEYIESEREKYHPIAPNAKPIED